MGKVNLKSATDEVEAYVSKESAYFEKVSKNIIDICNSLEKTWSGSWAGYHANLYFKNYQTPTVQEMFDSEWGGAGVFHGGYDPGWQSKTLDEVWQYVSAKSAYKFDLDEADSKLDELQELIKDLKLQLELATNNKILKKKINDVDVSFNIGNYIRIRTPRTVTSRDSKAMHQGIQVPPHIQCLGFGQALRLNMQAAKELLKLSHLVEPVEPVITKHALSKQSTSKKEQPEPKTTSVWHYTNPFWLLFRGLTLIYRIIVSNKIKSLVGFVIALITLLAIDYGLAWSNTKSLLNFLGINL